MLLYLADFLMSFDSGFRVFHYLTFRAILGVLTSLGISLWIGPAMIDKLTVKKIGQSIRELGPQSHYQKSGTPTMGGTLILIAIAVSTLLWADLSNRYIWVILLVTLGYGVIGFLDDYKKVIKRNSDGLSAKAKYLGQSVIGLVAALFLYNTAVLPAETQFIFPFFKDVIINMGWMYIVMTYFVIVGTSNAVNLTDGLDGLAIMPTVLVATGLSVFAYLFRTYRFCRIPCHPLFAQCRRIGGVLCGLGGRGVRLFVVQHLSGDGVYGRCRRFGFRWRVRRVGGAGQARNCPGHHGRRVCHGNFVGHHPSGLI